MNILKKFQNNEKKNKKIPKKKHASSLNKLSLFQKMKINLIDHVHYQ